MAKSAKFKVVAKKAAPKVEKNEGDYSNVAPGKSNKSGGVSRGPRSSGSGANTYKSSGIKAPAQGQGVEYVGAKNPGKSTISELPGQMTKPIPVPTKPKRPVAKRGK